MQCAQGVFLFLVLAVNSTRFRIYAVTRSYTLAARSYALLLPASFSPSSHIHYHTIKQTYLEAHVNVDTM